MVLRNKELLELPKDSTDIYKRSMINGYQTRPFEDVIDKLCYASFLKRYHLKQKPTENDFQPNELVDEVVEVNHASISSYPKVLGLSSVRN